MKKILILPAIASMALVQACGTDSFELPAVSNSAPELALSFPKDSSITDQSSMVFRGTATEPDGDAIAAVDVMDASGMLLASVVPIGGEWATTVPLMPGENSLVVQVRDASGASSQSSVSVRRDVLSNALAYPVYSAQTDRIYAVGQDPVIFGTALTFPPDFIQPSLNPPILLDPDDFIVIDPGGGYALPAVFPGSIIQLDPATGTRSILSGPDAGEGPHLVSPDVLALNSIDGSLIVYDRLLDAFVRIDGISGDREILFDLANISISSPGNAVVDAANNRLLFNFGFDFWQHSFIDGTTLPVVNALVPSAGTGVTGGVALSQDGNFLYFNAGVIVELDLLSLTARALNADAQPTASNRGIILDEANGRVIVAADDMLLGIDISSGASEPVMSLAASSTPGGFIQRGRSATEILLVDFGIDRVSALDIATGTITVLGGSTRGAGPRLGNINFLYNAQTGQAVFAQLDLNEAFGYDLISVDIATGDRSLIALPAFPASNSQFRTFNAALELDNTGDILLLSSLVGLALHRIDLGSGTVSSILEDSSTIGGPPLMCLDTTTQNVFTAQHGATGLQRIHSATGDFDTVSSFDDAIGAGPANGPISAIACDLAGRRIIAVAGRELYAIDFESGDRTLLTDAVPDTALAPLIVSNVALSTDGQTAYVTGQNGSGLAAINLASGERVDIVPDTELSRFVPAHIEVVDDTTAVVSDFGGSLWLLDLASGSRVIVSR